MPLTQFWLTLIGMSVIASALGLSCYGACRILKPHPAIGLLLTGLLVFFSLGTNIGFLFVFPVSYLCLRCGVELHRKTKEDEVENSQGIIFTATAVTLLLGSFCGAPYLSHLSFYAPHESAVKKIATAYITILAVMPSLAPLLWMRNLNIKETNNELASYS